MIGCLLWLIMSASGNMFKCQDSDFEEVTRTCPLVAGEGNHFCVPFLGLRCHAVVGPYSYCEKLPQTSDIKHHKFILAILEARNPKSRNQQRHTLSGGSGKRIYFTFLS